MRALALLLALLLAAAPARAGFTASDVGTAGAQFLKLGAGARAAGMAEAYTAIADEADAIYWNPASLPRIDGRSAAFMHSVLPAGVNYEFAGYGQSLGRSGGVGASVQYLSQPGIDQTDSAGDPTGSTFHPADVAAAVGAGYTVRKEDLGLITGASFGVTGKYIESTLTRTVRTYAADVAFLSRPFDVFDHPVRVSYVAQNLGGALKFQQKSDNLPTNLRLGSSFGLTKDWVLALDVDEPVDNHGYLAAGTEYRASFGEDATFAGRFGFNTRNFSDAGGLGGFAFGVGARFHSLGVDYSFSPLGALGATHTVSIGYKF